MVRSVSSYRAGIPKVLFHYRPGFRLRRLWVGTNRESLYHKGRLSLRTSGPTITGLVSITSSSFLKTSPALRAGVLRGGPLLFFATQAIPWENERVDSSETGLVGGKEPWAYGPAGAAEDKRGS